MHQKVFVAVFSSVCMCGACVEVCTCVCGSRRGLWKSIRRMCEKVREDCANFQHSLAASKNVHPVYIWSCFFLISLYNMHFVYSALSVFKSPFQTAWFWPGASVCVAAMCLLPCASCVSSCVFHIPESVVFACHKICRKRQTFAFSKQKPGSRSVLSILSLLCLWSQHWQSFTAGILLRNDDHISCKTFTFICKAYS